MSNKSQLLTTTAKNALIKIIASGKYVTVPDTKFLQFGMNSISFMCQTYSLTPEESLWSIDECIERAETKKNQEAMFRLRDILSKYAPENEWYDLNNQVKILRESAGKNGKKVKFVRECHSILINEEVVSTKDISSLDEVYELMGMSQPLTYSKDLAKRYMSAIVYKIQNVG